MGGTLYPFQKLIFIHKLSSLLEILFGNHKYYFPYYISTYNYFYTFSEYLSVWVSEYLIIHTQPYYYLWDLFILGYISHFQCFLCLMWLYYTISFWFLFSWYGVKWGSCMGFVFVQALAIHIHVWGKGRWARRLIELFNKTCLVR